MRISSSGRHVRPAGARLSGLSTPAAAVEVLVSRHSPFLSFRDGTFHQAGRPDAPLDLWASNTKQRHRTRDGPAPSQRPGYHPVILRGHSGRRSLCNREPRLTAPPACGSVRPAGMTTPAWATSSQRMTDAGRGLCRNYSRPRSCRPLLSRTGYSDWRGGAVGFFRGKGGGRGALEIRAGSGVRLLHAPRRPGPAQTATIAGMIMASVYRPRLSCDADPDSRRPMAGILYTAANVRRRRSLRGRFHLLSSPFTTTRPEAPIDRRPIVTASRGMANRRHMLPDGMGTFSWETPRRGLGQWQGAQSQGRM